MDFFWEVSARIGVMWSVVLLQARGKLHGFLLWKTMLGRNIMETMSLVYATHPSKTCSLHLASANIVLDTIHWCSGEVKRVLVGLA